MIDLLIGVRLVIVDTVDVMDKYVHYVECVHRIHLAKP
jgi:hypothetical protein